MTDWPGEVRDADANIPVLASEERFHGAVWGVRSDTIEIHGHTVVRDLMVHPGAVGIMVLDDDDRVLLIRQYRHPIGQFFFEPPAGLLDKPDEDPLVAAQRELAEEAGLRARHWHVLVDFCNTPGGSTETFRCYLARGLSRLPEGRHQTGEAEEVDLPQAWLTLDDARLAVLDGRLQNPTTVTGVLAAWSARATGWDTLRPADAPWPRRERVVDSGRVYRMDRGHATGETPSPADRDIGSDL